ASGASSSPAHAPLETDRIVSVALEPRCVAIEVEGDGDASTLLGVLEADPAAIWTWVETHPLAPGKVLVRGVAPAPGPNEEALRERCRPHRAICRVCRDVAVVSLVGEGILSRPALLAEAWKRLSEAGVEVRAARSASLSLSYLVAESQAGDAVRCLHAAFLEEPSRQ
ncbi:MAG: hypothetical protein QUU85_05330, partial [Candidatus Eisenbacteria bacterium]|nr:hypothetical protein [Candidatus Eisenbacteria bacterium]